MTSEALQRESLRQQALLRALWRDAPPAAFAGWLRGEPARLERGLQAYQANAGALAERALAAAYPTLQQLLGEASFAQLARAFWHAHPPLAADLGRWGGALAAFIDGDEQLAGEPYLAGMAELEWALHQAATAADPAPPTGLQRLASDDPAQLRVQLQPGTALVSSRFALVTLWQAHRSDDADAFAAVRAAFAAQRGEQAFVFRDALQPRVIALAAADARFVAALLRGESLAIALAIALEIAPAIAAGTGAQAFSFETWLVDALRQGWLAGVCDA